jgi:hypothetical protein
MKLVGFIELCFMIFPLFMNPRQFSTGALTICRADAWRVKLFLVVPDSINELTVLWIKLRRILWWICPINFFEKTTIRTESY